ncbi:MAG: zf-HC2 domain-containing protein [Blastocatellia bacterium]|nr:zf-HC2 domain-containing protein [Blastocatellia bacterium]
MSDRQMDCREMFARLSEYLDGELDEDLCQCFDSHMRDCEPCLAFLATLKKTVELCRSASDAEPALARFGPEEIALFESAYEKARQAQAS